MFQETFIQTTKINYILIISRVNVDFVLDLTFCFDLNLCFETVE